MRRYQILKGDSTTSGGKVLDGNPNDTYMGTPIAYDRAQIYCPACDSFGRACAVGPFHPDTMDGLQVLLDDDLCLCKCDPPPRLIASQRGMWHEFPPEPSPNKLDRLEHVLIGAECGGNHAIHFRLTDGVSGVPLAQQPIVITADGQTFHKITDNDGQTELVYTGTAPKHVTCQILGVDDLFGEGDA